ncbi:MAG: c-type cytochrome [Pseudomonadota bacterium]
MARLMLMFLAVLPMAAFAAGDPEAGQAKSAICAACHGVDGNSVVTAWPKIAGQHSEYIARQTRMVRDEQRSVPEMYPLVVNLTDQDIDDIAAYFAEQALSPGVADEALVELGQQIYQAGNKETGVPACSACHGPSGNGILGAQYPVLRAQHADYTISRLNRYRDGQANLDDSYSLIMVGVAQHLTDEEITAVSSYIEGLHRAR